MGKTTSLRVKQSGKLAGSADLNVLIYPIKSDTGYYPEVFTLQVYYNYPYFGLTLYNVGTSEWTNGTGGDLTPNLIRARIYDRATNGLVHEIAPWCPVNAIGSGGYSEVFHADRSGATVFPQLYPGQFRFELEVDPLDQWGTYKRYGIDFTINDGPVGFNGYLLEGSGNLALLP